MRVFLGVLLASLVFAGQPLIASAQALSDEMRQTMVVLRNDILYSDSIKLARQAKGACDQPDPETVAGALADLNALDQRAVAVADATSSIYHVEALRWVRLIETSYDSLANPVASPYCYTPPDA